MNEEKAKGRRRKRDQRRGEQDFKVLSFPLRSRRSIAERERTVAEAAAAGHWSLCGSATLSAKNCSCCRTAVAVHRQCHYGACHSLAIDLPTTAVVEDTVILGVVMPQEVAG